MNIRFARSEAERLIKKLKITELNLPVNVKAIAKSLNLKVIETELDEDVSGLLVSDKSLNNLPHIFVNKDNSPVRKRFTISHEIGHYVLKHEFENQGVHIDKGFAIPRNSRASLGIDPKEIQANQFAASLLMPSQLVINAVKQIESPLFDYDISSLAKKFKVSEQAMTIRLTNLKIL